MGNTTLEREILPLLVTCALVYQTNQTPEELSILADILPKTWKRKSGKHYQRLCPSPPPFNPLSNPGTHNRHFAGMPRFCQNLKSLAANNNVQEDQGRRKTGV